MRLLTDYYICYQGVTLASKQGYFLSKFLKAFSATE